MGLFEVTIEILGLGGIILLIIGVVILFLCLGLGTNSGGTIDGRLTHLDIGGFPWRTTDAVLAVGGFDSSGNAYTESFSVCNNDPELTAQVQNYTGQNVQIAYNSPLIYESWVQNTPNCILSIQASGANATN